MDLLKAYVLKALCFLLLTSCAKVGYISEQAVGQMALEYDDIDVQEFLDDPKQKKEYQQKVNIVLKAKDYFYNYFDIKKVPIYDEVKILDQDAVTYLVIHSPKDEIKAIRTWFPIMGSFPYLGFFSKDSANGFENEKKKAGFHTYQRPVYAYSTLNHPLMPFDDNILSSFFFYNDRALAELIFHELTHTIIFLGDNISFNENLANFISEKLLIEYLKLNKAEELKIKSKQERQKKLGQKIVVLSKELNQMYKAKKSLSDFNPKNILASFLEQKFLPEIKSYCAELGMEKCWPLKQDWNNARFAALGTYNSKLTKIEKIYNNSGLSLKDFVKKLIQLAQNTDESSNLLKVLEKSL